MGRPPAEREVPAPVGLAHDDRDLRHLGPGEARDDALVAAEDAAALGVRADHQAGHVLQEDEREVERVAEVDERGLLRQRRNVHHAGALHRLARDDADRLPLDPRQAAEHAGAVPLAPRLDAVRVEDRLEHLAHVVAAPRVARARASSSSSASRAGARGGGRRSGVLGRVGEVGEHALDRRDRRLLVVDDEVGVAALRARRPSGRRAPRRSAPRRSRPRSPAGPESAIAESFVITTKWPIAACSAESPKLAPRTAIRRGTSGRPRAPARTS